MRLVNRFCELVDACRHGELADLWIKDAEWITWRGPLPGHEAIRTCLDAKPQTEASIHVMQNVVIDVEDDENARGSAVFIYFGSDRDDASAHISQGIGRYEDRFRLTSAG